MFEITIRCEKEPESHAKKLRLFGCDREYVEQLARLLDGTSTFYIYKPGPQSPIGKCGICGGTITARVEEVENKKRAET